MSSDVGLEVAYRIANAPIREFPYPHIYVEEVFPRDYYAEIRAHLPPREAFRTLNSMGRVTANYPEERLVLPLVPEDLAAVTPPYTAFWQGVWSWLLGENFGAMVMSHFHLYLQQRFANVQQEQFADEALLVQDLTNYWLAPHTDAPNKVLSFLFYLPPDDSQAHLGTTIYVPRDPGFTCPGGPHHAYERFRRVCTMPYVPNTLFAFLKTPFSFHGVETIKDANVRRDLLLYDIKVETKAVVQPVAAPAPAAVPTKFTF